MTPYIQTVGQLHEMVEAYSEFDEFAFDVETRGDSLNFRTNDVFWIGFAGPGRTDVIPIGHALGRLLKPAQKIKAAHDQCPDRRRCTSCPERTLTLTKAGKPSMRQVTHMLSARYGEPPEQLTHDDVWPVLGPLFFSDRRKVGHNVKFDVKSIAKYYDGMVPPPPYGDTNIAAILVNENHIEGYKLGPTTKREFGFSYEKIGAIVDTVSFEQARYYNAMDVRWTWLLWRRLWNKLKRENLLDVLSMEMSVLEVVIAMEMAGCPIDIKGFEALHGSLDVRLRQLEKQIEEAYGGPINLNADAQVRDLVFNVRGHRHKGKDNIERFLTEKTGQVSVSRASLEGFAYKNPRLDPDVTVESNIKDPVVAAVLEHAQVHKLFSTYMDNNLANVQAEGRLFAEFDQMGARTGRFSSRSPNLQNIPVRRGKEVRSLFIAGPGMKMVVADYSQVELRVLAHFSEDKNLMRAYPWDGEALDLHTLTARVAYKIPDDQPVPLEKRALAKNVNFSVSFGATAYTLMNRYEVATEEEAQALIDGFYRAYPKVKYWKEKLLRECRASYHKKAPGMLSAPPYITTISGRKRRLPQILWEDNRERNRAERQAINTKIQGSAADITKLAMIRLHARLPECMKIILCVHDELVVLAPEDRAEECMKITVEEMESAIKLKVPLKVDAHIVDNWAAAK